MSLSFLQAIVLRECAAADDKYEAQVCGSYRRGKWAKKVGTKWNFF